MIFALLLLAIGSMPLLAFGVLALWRPTRRASSWVYGASLAGYGGLAGYVWAQAEPVGPHEASDAFVLALYFAVGASGPLVAGLTGLALLGPRGTRAIGLRVLRWLPACLVGAAIGLAIGRLESRRETRVSPTRTAQAMPSVSRSKVTPQGGVRGRPTSA